MGDRIRNTQERHSKKRFIDRGAKVDVIFPSTHSSISHELGAEWKFVGPTSTPQYGETVVFDIPKATSIGDLMVEFNFGSGTGDFTTFPALSSISRVDLLSQSGNELHSYDYAAVMSSVFSHLMADEIAIIQEAAGGSSFASGRCVMPLFTTWGRLGHRGKTPPPLPTDLLNGKLRLELRIRPEADLRNAGSTADSALTSMRLWYLQYNRSSSQRADHLAKRGTYSYKGVDWQTNIDNAVTASTATTFDISGFHGSLASLYVFSKSTANKVTANDYYILSDIDDMRVIADGDQLFDMDNRNAMLLSALLHDDLVDNGALGTGTVVNFGFADPMSKTMSFIGGIHLNDINQFEIDALDTADTGVIDICGWFDVEYMINSSGEIRRVR